MKDNQLNEDFVNARKKVEELLGIKLTLIELVELRNILKFTTETFERDYKINRIDKFTINPVLEGVYLFMNTNYGTQINSRLEADIFSMNKRKAKKLIGYDYYSEYFRRVQEEMHFP